MNFIAPGDYGSLSDQLTFSASVTRQCVNISIVDDDAYEDIFEDFEATLTLEEDDPAITINPERAVINIMDDDSKERFAISVCMVFWMTVCML